MNNIKDMNTLETVPANRALIDGLYANDLIDRTARVTALEAIHPHKNWALWIDRLLLAFGAALVLAGIVYFFAFNWAVIAPLVKLYTIQAGLALCLAGAIWQGLDNITGKSMLTAASVLIGVFLAVFGQVYQTGADAWQLFAMWSGLTLGFAFLCNFVGHWMLWLAVSNIALSLWWDQAALPSWDMRDLIFTISGLFSVAALTGRELFAAHAVRKEGAWAPPRWTRVVLGLTIIGNFIPPMCEFMFDGFNGQTGMIISALTGFVVLVGLHSVYRFYLPDLWAVSVAVLGWCCVAEAFVINLLSDYISYADAMAFLLVGMATIALFAGAVIYLRSLAADTTQTEGRA